MFVHAMHFQFLCEVFLFVASPVCECCCCCIDDNTTLPSSFAMNEMQQECSLCTRPQVASLSECQNAQMLTVVICTATMSTQANKKQKFFLQDVVFTSEQRDMLFASWIEVQ